MKGVSVSASVACVPIASAKVRRISAPRKEMHKKTHFFVKSGHNFAFRLCKPCQNHRFQGHFGAFRRAFGRKVGETRSQGLGGGQENEGEGRGLLYIIRRKRGRERRKGHGRGQQKSQTGAPNRRLRERRQWEGRLRMTILRGQSEDFEGAL